jgi:hypothetical protein
MLLYSSPFRMTSLQNTRHMGWRGRWIHFLPGCYLNLKMFSGTKRTRRRRRTRTMLSSLNFGLICLRKLFFSFCLLVLCGCFRVVSLPSSRRVSGFLSNGKLEGQKSSLPGLQIFCSVHRPSKTSLSQRREQAKHHYYLPSHSITASPKPYHFPTFVFVVKISTTAETSATKAIPCNPASFLCQEQHVNNCNTKD